MTRYGSEMDEHRHEAVLEDALFLLDGGADMSEVAARLGVKRKTLEKSIERHRKKAEQ